MTNSDPRLQRSDSEHDHEQEQERCIRASSFLRHFMSLSGGFASRQYVATCYGSLHPNHWSLTSPGLVPATLAVLPPIRAAPARACSSLVLRHSSVLYCCVQAAENSDGQGPEVRPSRQARDFEAVTGLTM